MVSISKLGEFGFVRKIRKLIGPARGNVKIGPGDDAALVKMPGGYVLATKDILIENVHFDFRFASPFEVGWQAMAANLSDIAAMGGWPCYALAGIGAGRHTSVDALMAIYRGMMKLASRFNCRIVGGDTVATEGPMVISITVIGMPSGKNVFLRSSARPGDRVFITGWPGRAALALKRKRFIKIMPRLEEIKYLSKKLRINALIDTSDGLSSDLTRITEESGVGALIFEKSLPVASILKRIKINERLALLLNGGEDFELLFTAPERDITELAAQFKKIFKIPLTLIGEIKPEGYGVRIVNRYGRERPIKARGYEHFRS